MTNIQKLKDIAISSLKAMGRYEEWCVSQIILPLQIPELATVGRVGSRSGRGAFFPIREPDLLN